MLHPMSELLPPAARRPLALIALSFVIALLAWDTILIYPLKLLVVFLHESGHALAALATGGSVESIRIDPYERGVTATRGGWRFLILSGGYLGSTALGAAILNAAWTRALSRHVLRLMAVLLAVAILGFVRDPFTIFFCAATGAALWLAGVKATPTAQRALATFIGVTSCLYAVIDIKDDVLSFGGLTFVGGVGKSDAEALAESTWVPAPVWGVLWIGISLFVIWRVLRRIAAAGTSAP